MKFVYTFVVFGTLVNCIPVQVQLNRETGNGGGYFGKIFKDDGGGVHHLNLTQSSTNIFHPNIKVFSLSNDTYGIPFHWDVTPSKESINLIESNIFTNINDENTVLRVVDGIGIHGLVNGQSISFINGEHDLIELPQNNDTVINDFVDIPGDNRVWLNNSSSLMKERAYTRTVVTLELYLVIDLATNQYFEGNVAKIMEYFALFMKGVNSRFGSIGDPRVTITIIGMSVIQTPLGQPFIENALTPNGLYNISKIIDEFGKYMHVNAANYPSFDKAALVTGVSFNTNTIGIAYLGGTCRNLYKVSVTQDIEGNFKGMHTMTHEIGHNLGSPHDGEQGSAACPLEYGFLMHTHGGSYHNRTKFSYCSAQTMKNYIKSPLASCLFTVNVPGAGWAVPTGFPHGRDTMDYYCKTFVHPDAIVNPIFSPDALCENINCQYYAPCPAPYQNQECRRTATTYAAKDGTLCGWKDGRCFGGKCYGN